jgi:hypothetical protein
MRQTTAKQCRTVKITFVSAVFSGLFPLKGISSENTGLIITIITIL